MIRSAQHPVQEMLHVLQEAKAGLSAVLESEPSPSKIAGLKRPSRADVLRSALEATEMAYSTHPFVWPHLMGPRMRALQKAAAFLAKPAMKRRSAPSTASLPLIRTLLRACSAILCTWPNRGRRKATRAAKRLDRLISRVDTLESAAAAAAAAGSLIDEMVPRPAFEPPADSPHSTLLVPSSLLSAAPLTSAPG